MLKNKLFRAAMLAGLFLVVGGGTAGAAVAATTDVALLKQIPSFAQAVVIIHDPALLDKKVATLAQKLKIPVLPPPLKQIETNMSLPHGIEADGAVALVGIPDSAADKTAHTVIIASAKDPAAVIANAKMHLAFGKDGLAHGQSADGRDIYVMPGKSCILESHDRLALLQFKTITESVAPMLTESERPSAEHSDIYALINIAAIRKPVEEHIDKSEARDEMTAADASHIQLERLGKRAAVAMLNSTDSALFAWRISSDAITQSVIADVKPGTGVAKVLQCLRPLPSTPFKGLPDAHNIFELGAQNLDGAMAANLMNHWGRQIAAAEHGKKDKYGLTDMLSKLAALVHDITMARSLAVISSKPRGSLYSAVQIANSTNAQASAAVLTELLVKEMAVLTKFETNMKMGIQYRTTVSPKPVVIKDVPFTVIRQKIIPPPGETPQADAMRHAMAMQQSLTGLGKQTILVGGKGGHLISGSDANMGHPLIADAIQSLDSGSDALDANPDIMAAAKHVLPQSSAIVYLDFSPMIATMTQRMKVMINMNTPAIQMPATEPMSLSISTHDGTVHGKMRMPMKNLEQLSARIHALLPLLMMMEMQAMQGGGGGANQPQ